MLAASVLIPSFRRPQSLARCLASLTTQTLPPAEVLVVWQADDTATRDLFETVRQPFPYRLRLLHCSAAGIVPAENLALEAARGDVILLIDDDAVAPPNWIAGHLKFYADASVGAVGGPADNYTPEGNAFPERRIEPVGKLTWYGKNIGNTHDQARSWRERAPLAVDHLTGYNMSLRRSAFDRFEEGLRPYWQMFELDACLQARARGFRVLFDFANVVDHFPTNTVFAGARDSDVQIKFANGGYNLALILAKHSPRGLAGLRFLYLLSAGAISSPGLIACAAAILRFGRPRREIRILWMMWRAVVAGWSAGKRKRYEGANGGSNRVGAPAIAQAAKT